mgnify:FL=1
MQKILQPQMLSFNKILVLPLILFFSLNIYAQDTNVLWISIDDLNNWVGYLQGHPQVKTPNMDRLAARGIAFTNAHCTTPLCKPSRTAILTGQSETANGVFRNGDDFNHSDFQLIPEYFAENNYITYGTGKIHHNSINDEIFQHYYNTMQRWSPFSSSKQVEYSEEELPSKGTDNPRHVIENGPGGKTYVLPFNRMSSERSPGNPKGESFDWASYDLPDTAFGDGRITNWAIDQLKEHEDDHPFFMGVGYYRPHIPLYAPKKYFDLYPIESIQLPEVISNDLDDIPEAGRERALSAVTAGTHAHVVANHQWKNAVQAYLACISFIDFQIGKILDYLDNSPYANNTVIVLFSDHGWHLGEKQAWGKWSPWLQSTNTPFIICPAGNTDGALCYEPVSLLDIYPTLIDMLGLPEKTVSGVSLVPLFTNPALSTNRVVRTHVGRGTYALSNAEWRYIYYENGDEELYNIRKDPMEFDNLIEKKKYRSIIKDMKEKVR